MDKVQYLFYFTSDDLCILETKRLGLSSQASMSDVYKWLIYFKSSHEFVTLSFLKMIKEEHCEYRSFAEGELKFDATNAELNYQGKVYKFLRNDPALITQDLKLETLNFLLGLAQNS